MLHCWNELQYSGNMWQILTMKKLRIETLFPHERSWMIMTVFKFSRKWAMDLSVLSWWCWGVLFLYPNCWRILSWKGVVFYQMLPLHLFRLSYGFVSSSCECDVSFYWFAHWNILAFQVQIPFDQGGWWFECVFSLCVVPPSGFGIKVRLALLTFGKIFFYWFWIV